MTPILLLGLCGSISVTMYMLLTQAKDRTAVRTSLTRIEHYELQAAGTSDLGPAGEPLTDRVFLPLLRAATRLGRRLTPADYVAKVRNKLIVAGSSGADDVDRFLAARVGALLIAPAGFFLAFWVLKLPHTQAWMIVFLCCLIAGLGPSARLNRKIAERHKVIQTTLPEVLELLTISVEAGLGFEQALDRAVDAVPGPLSDELARMLGEMRAGARRSDALKAFDERIGMPDVHSFALAVLQADTFGVPITRVLRAQADDMRVRRRQLAQEAAMKAPVKMLFPMVFCIFPALFVVIIGPAAINMIHSLK